MGTVVTLCPNLSGGVNSVYSQPTVGFCSLCFWTFDTLSVTPLKDQFCAWQMEKLTTCSTLVCVKQNHGCFLFLWLIIALVVFFFYVVLFSFVCLHCHFTCLPVCWQPNEGSCKEQTKSSHCGLWKLDGSAGIAFHPRPKPLLWTGQEDHKSRLACVGWSWASWEHFSSSLSLPSFLCICSVLHKASCALILNAKCKFYPQSSWK